MNLAYLEAFVAVAETGSINRAALRLGLTQPAITRRVQNFEAIMGGAALLDRSAKPPVLTPGGRQALEHCRRVLSAVTELQGASQGAKPAGELRIGIAHSLAEIVLASPLDDLRRRFPELRLHVSSDWTARLVEEVRNGGLDCAVALTTNHHRIASGVTAAFLGSERVVVVAARHAKLSGVGKHRLRLRDLAEQVWVLNPSECGYRAALQRAFDRQKATLRVAAEVPGYDLQLSLIGRGVGLGLVPRRRFDSSPQRRSLRIVNVADFTLEGRVAMLQATSLGSLAAALDHLQEGVAARLGNHKSAASSS